MMMTTCIFASMVRRAPVYQEALMSGKESPYLPFNLI